MPLICLPTKARSPDWTIPTMKDLNIELYRKLYLIRRAEDSIRRNYFDDKMKTPMHMSTGGEAICTGVCHALAPQDQVMGTYRSHGIYLAKSGGTDRFFAEMYGKATGMAMTNTCCKPKRVLKAAPPSAPMTPVKP